MMTLLPFLRRASASLALAALSATATAQPSFTFSTARRGAVIGPLHYGLFYEEINHGGDGGLYAELIRNRSFEDNAQAADCWWPLGPVAFEVVSTGLMNSAQDHALKMTVGEYNAGIRNEGFWGMKLVQGETYTLTFWAKTDGTYTGKLWAELQDDVFTNLGRTEFEVQLTQEWRRFEVQLTATASETKGWLALKALEPMTLYLDVVSLMPPTYKGRANGCRRDLAEMLEALHPRFLRFPGGCYVEGTWQDGRTNRFEWKQTIGPIETRPGHWNVNWGYRVSDGLGFHELLQLAEDLGAEPLFVCNAGLGHGWAQPYDDIGAYIQEALDALEYANGDVTTPYGARRAAAGHPKPFGLRLIEVGNENYNFVWWDNGDMSDHYAERYRQFHDAIKTSYPDVTIIANVEAWATDEPSWRNGHPVEVVDEHYYRPTDWFRRQYDKYDTYSRDGGKVYAGEYAVTSDFGSWGNLNAALAEAIYMAGMERNADVCVMASYAPILCNENHPGPWMPDLIRFNATSAFGTPSYWVQQLMAANVGHQNITWREEGNVVNVGNTAVALSSWATSVSYDNLRIADALGNVRYATDFSDADDYLLNWNPTGGAWNIDGGTLNQTSTSTYGLCNVCYNLTGDNCTIELDARKNSGAEGFLVAFSYNDPQNYVWWNLGGWGNTQHAIEQCVDGVKTTLAAAPGSLATGTDYHLRIVKNRSEVSCYVGDSLYHRVDLSDSRKLYACAALNEAEDTLVLKLVNPYGTAQEAYLHFKDFERAGRVTRHVLTSTNGTDENVMQNPTKVRPKTSTFAPTGSDRHAMTCSLPAYSLSVMLIPVASVSPEVEVAADEEWTDVTERLRNANFASGTLGWNGTAFSAAPGTVAEFFNTTFDTYQTLTDMPAGDYRFTIDGFYRQGSIQKALADHISGTEQRNALIYIVADGQTATQELPSLYEETSRYTATPNYTYPDNVAQASNAFNLHAAYKANSVGTTLSTQGGTLRVGLRKTKAVGADWTCFDNAHLYYRKNEAVGIGEAGAATARTAKDTPAVFDLSGRRLTASPTSKGFTEGVYIVNGKKIIIR